MRRGGDDIVALAVDAGILMRWIRAHDTDRRHRQTKSMRWWRWQDRRRRCAREGQLAVHVAYRENAAWVQECLSLLCGPVS